MRALRLFPALALLLLTATASAKPPKAVRHTIQRGETLSSIATKYNTNVSSILRWNAMKRSARLTPGAKIGVPLPPGTTLARVQGNTAGSKKGASGTSAAATTSTTSDAVAKKTWQEYTEKPARPGYVKLKSYSSEWEGQVVDAKGRLLPTVQGNVSGVLSSWRTSSMRAIDERLIQLIAQVSDRFGGRTIRVVSGYRAGSGKSRHHHGAAIDFSIEGVPNWAVRQYLLTLSNVGVGYYPNSYHVHLDVRDRTTHWVDVSRPGQRARYVKPKRRTRKATRRNTARRSR
ncbi:MAG TPA: DUF882 domain-containing protein [Polyangiaceae bacterium]|nr:DUF882 domain-containing protein [Polyangiaceae bacterium]HMR75793.1 DUF882 domain-containing protein [Polyangiaceae bacterium]